MSAVFTKIIFSFNFFTTIFTVHIISSFTLYYKILTIIVNLKTKFHTNLTFSVKIRIGLDSNVDVNAIVKVEGGFMRYKIGDFAKLLNTSVRTLRYYNSLGLLIPVEIDVFTGYRYYDDKQINDFNKIKLLQEAGFSLEEIKKYQGLLTNEIMLEKKKELLKETQNINEKIKKIDYLRSYLKDGDINFNPKQLPDKNKKILRR